MDAKSLMESSKNAAVVVRGIGHAVLETADLEKAVEHYEKVLGLSVVSRERDAAYLSCPNDYNSLVLKRGEPGCRHLTFQLDADDDLNHCERVLRAQGLNVERQRDSSLGISDQLVFNDPNGTRVGLYCYREPIQRPGNPDGVKPLKIGHVAFNSGDAKEMAAFYKDILGFRVSDWIADFFVFLRCGQDHHTVNFLTAGSAKMNHIAFELRDIDHLQRACDGLGMSNVRLIWGPGRHGPGHNLFTYHHDADGNIVELFTQLDSMSDEENGAFDTRPWHEDHPQRPKIWQPNWQSMNLWGSEIPSIMMDGSAPHRK